VSGPKFKPEFRLEAPVTPERTAKTKRGPAVLAFLVIWTILNALFLALLKPQGGGTVSPIVAVDFIVWLAGVVIGSRIIRQRMTRSSG